MMIDVEPREQTALAQIFPDRPGPMAGQHVIAIGRGRCVADRLPSPRVAIARVGYDVQLAGEPERLDDDSLRDMVPMGFIDASPGFETTLTRVFPGVVRWGRVIATLESTRPPPSAPATIRRLTTDDASALSELEDDLDWISASHGGHGKAAASTLAFGAFVGTDLASVAIPFHVGPSFEDIGVVTRPTFRGRGLSPACAAHVAADVRARGRIPSWSTSPDNFASLAVAKKLGARKHRDDVLWVTGTEVPRVATVKD